jgi:hypothetical protein
MSRSCRLVSHFGDHWGTATGGPRLGSGRLRHARQPRSALLPAGSGWLLQAPAPTATGWLRQAPARRGQPAERGEA